MTIIDLIGAAIGCGARDDGCKDGPRALLQAGAQQRLQTPDTHGGLVHGIELATPAGHSRAARLAALPGVAGFSRALADATAHSVHEGHVPVVIGGDHSCAIGTWSGVASALRPAGPLGLIWIDAHLDSHTPQSSDSGAIHGMPLAALLGHGARELTQVRDTHPAAAAARGGDRRAQLRAGRTRADRPVGRARDRRRGSRPQRSARGDGRGHPHRRGRHRGLRGDGRSGCLRSGGGTRRRIAGAGWPHGAGHDAGTGRLRPPCALRGVRAWWNTTRATTRAGSRHGWRWTCWAPSRARCTPSAANMRVRPESAGAQSLMRNTSTPTDSQSG